MSRRQDRDAFRRGYRDAMLWANTMTDDGDGLAFAPGDVTDQCARYARRLHPTATATMRADSGAFLDYAPSGDSTQTCEDIIRRAVCDNYTFTMAGVDFALTRNGHGAGFWDRGLGAEGQELTDAAKSFGSSQLYLCADGRIYAEGA